MLHHRRSTGKPIHSEVSYFPFRNKGVHIFVVGISVRVSTNYLANLTQFEEAPMSEHVRTYTTYTDAVNDFQLGIRGMICKRLGGVINCFLATIKNIFYAFPLAHDVVATLYQRQRRWFNVATTPCVQWVIPLELKSIYCKFVSMC